MQRYIFIIGVALLFTHELDAMLNAEWRILPLTSWLPDETGSKYFLLAHIPLFAIILALVTSANGLVRKRTAFWLSLFLVVHGVLHAIFMGSSGYEFQSILSNMLIFGGAVCGILYMTLNIKSKGSVSFKSKK